MTGRFEDIGARIGALVEEKQAAYGDSFGQAGRILAVLYPGGVPVDKYDDMLTVVRIIDKLFRVATAKDALGENPYQDIAGYAILAVAARTKGGDAILEDNSPVGSD